MIFILLNIVSVWITVASEKLCPVSNAANFRLNGDHYYPLDFYNKSVLDAKPIAIKTELCQIREGISSKMLNYTCPVAMNGCPMIDENIIDGLQNSSSWKKSTSLCLLKELLLNPKETINVFIFGGSVTIGTNTQGCCSKPECLFKAESQYKRCAWSHYLEKWLKEHKANVNVHNIARAGTTTDASAEKMAEYFDLVKVKELSSKDIIFLDHSFNDNPFCKKSTFDSIQRGVEKLIRRLLTYSTLKSGGIPTIILMETDYRVSVYENYKACYTKMYKEIAQHYGLRVYSLVDAVFSENSATKQASYYNHLIKQEGSWGHPPWHAHLWYADFVSSLLQHEMDHCSTTYKDDGVVAPYELPKPLTSVNDSAKCNPLIKPFLKISYDDIMANTTIGQYSIPVKDTWQVRLDRKGRGGIITELTKKSKFSVAQKASVDFTLNLSIDELNKLNKQGGVVLQFVYMKSYENSGTVDMVICGNEKRIDSLWKEYKTFRYTTPAILTAPILACNGIKGSQNVTISVKHVLEGIKGVSSVEKYIKKVPRKANLFKIISVMVCKY